MRALLLLAVLGGSRPLAAQDWNSPPALALVSRGILRRGAATADTALHDYKALAHGFVFFLGQFGNGLTEPPRLIKTDQLELELYWKAPGASKQRIVGWRNAAQLPTDINYHRDHLGIIQNNFGRAIRLGEGDEVQDVPHPLSPGAQLDYDYALGDTQLVSMPGRAVRVVALRVRPKDFTAPRIVGTLYLDVATAALVRMAFDFTPASYRDLGTGRRERRAGRRVVGGPLLASLPAGDRDPPAGQLARLFGAGHHPGTLADRRVCLQSGAGGHLVRGRRDLGPPAGRARFLPLAEHAGAGHGRRRGAGPHR